MNINRNKKNKNNLNNMPIQTEPNLSSSRKLHYFSEKIGSKSAIKNRLKLNNTLSSKNNEKFITTGNNIFLLKTQPNYRRFNRTSNVVKLKNNMLFNKGIPGCSPYDPYLIKVCKNAIIKSKKYLPNYKDVINKINAEFGIEDDFMGHNRFAKNNKLIKTFDTLSEFKTNYTKDNNNFEEIKISINLKSKDNNDPDEDQK